MKQITEETEEASIHWKNPQEMFNADDAARLYSVQDQPGVQSHQMTREKQLPSSKASKYLVISY